MYNEAWKSYRTVIKDGEVKNLKKRTIKGLIVALIAALVVTMMPLTVSAASYKPGKVKITSVKVSAVSKKNNTATLTVKWNKVSKATGYEVYAKHATDTKWYRVKKVGRFYRGLEIKKTPAGKMQVKVRAIRKVKGKVYRGKFSVVKTKFITGKWNLTKAMNANGGKKELKKLNNNLAKYGAAMSFSGNTCTMTYKLEKMEPSLDGYVLNEEEKKELSQDFKDYIAKAYGGKKFAILLRDCSGVKKPKAVFTLKLNGNQVCSYSYVP